MSRTRRTGYSRKIQLAFLEHEHHELRMAASMAAWFNVVSELAMAGHAAGSRPS